MLGLRDLYASKATTSRQMAKRQPTNAKVGITSSSGREQEPGQTPQYSAFDDEMCVNDATWNSLTRFCCCEDSEVQYIERN